jgi:Tol biopolymer transport system component
MGEVYLARDTRLNRLVAIKTLLPSFAADEGRLKRFLQEAKVTSALNHPNIGHLYEIGEVDGTYYLALEYIEGPTLGARLRSGPLPLAELLDLAVQAADALAEAHSRGVLHRDIKPDNLMIDRRGQLKVLDFGLARMEAEAPADTSATLTQALTNPGVVMGTPRYMSPEQALGRPLDGRSDLFSLGVVLYQMATGALPFHGQTTPELTNAIINHAPLPPIQVNPQVPAELERIVLRAIEKDPGMRYQSAADLRSDLKRLKRDTESGQQAATAAIPVAAPPARAGKLIWISAAVLLVAATAASFVLLRPKPVPKAGGEITLTPILTSPTREVQPAISPDGRTVAYAWDGEPGKNFDIYVKLIDAGNPLRLTDTPENENWPLWSPDGKYVAFQREKGDRVQLVLIPSLGGVERILIDQAQVREAESGGMRLLYGWHPDGKSIAYVSSGSPEPMGIMSVEIESGTRRRLTTAPTGIYSEAAPVFMGDGSQLAYIRFQQFLSGSVELFDLKTNHSRTVLASMGSIRTMARLNEHELLISPGSGLNVRLLRLDEGVTRASGLPVGTRFPSVSANGQRMLVEQASVDYNIWHAAVDGKGRGGAPALWIGSTYADYDPRYRPQGDRIAFVSRRTGQSAVWLSDRDGRNQQPLAGGAAGGSLNWSPDGQWLAYDGRVNFVAQIWIVSAQGGAPRQLTMDQFENIVPSWSHDGQWIYYSSMRTGRLEVWRIPAAGGASEQITTQGGFDPIESADGAYLYFSRSREEPALVRRAKDGTEEVLIPKLSGRFWTLAKDGVYFASAAKDRLLFFDLASRKTREVLPITKPILLTQRHISVSPDGKELLWVQVDAESSDIMLVENYRP